jgi:hypothetical protein
VLETTTVVDITGIMADITEEEAIMGYVCSYAIPS